MTSVSKSSDISWVVTSPSWAVLRALENDDIACPTSPECLQDVLEGEHLRSRNRYVLVLPCEHKQKSTGSPPTLVYICFDGSVVVQICHPKVHRHNWPAMEKEVSKIVREEGFSPLNFTPIWQGDVIQRVFDVQARMQKSVNDVVMRATACSQG